MIKKNVCSSQSDYGCKLIFINMNNGPFIKCDNNFLHNISSNAKNHNSNDHMIIFLIFLIS